MTKRTASNDIRLATSIYDDNLFGVLVGSTPYGSIERTSDGWYAMTSNGRCSKVPFATAREATEALIARI